MVGVSSFTWLSGTRVPVNSIGPPPNGYVDSNASESASASPSTTPKPISPSSENLAMRTPPSLRTARPEPLGYPCFTVRRNSAGRSRGGRGDRAGSPYSLTLRPAMDVLLECRDLGKRYAGAMALDHVDLDVGPGEIRGLVGHNGAGKSTLLRCALGLVAPSAGVVRVLGRERPPRAGRALDGVAGLVDGMRWPAGMTAGALLRMLADYDGAPRSRVDEAVDRLSVVPYLDRRMATLSLGARQRVGVAAALLRAPRLL